MEMYPNGMMCTDRENGGYDYSAVDIVVDADIIVVTPEEYEENKGNEHSFIHEIVSTGKIVFEAKVSDSGAKR